MRISASDQVQAWLRRLPPKSKRRVRAGLRGLEDWRGDLKPLQGELEGFYRLRVGGYRIVCHLAEGQTARLDYADTRDLVYETFRRLQLLAEIRT